MKTSDNQRELYEIALQIIEEEKIFTINDNEELYLYQEGYFQRKGEATLKERIDTILKSDATQARVNEIIAHIKRKTYVDREELSSTPLEYINLENGVYNLKTKKLENQIWNYCFTHKLPLKYNQKAREPKKILKFFRELVGTENVKLLIQMFAYCLYRNNPHKIAFMLHGNTNSGKTTLLTFLTHFLGQENICNIELQTLDEDRFAKVRLYGKHVNYFDDLPSRAVTQTGVFKACTGNGVIEGEQKFKDRFSFKPFAKLIFAANQVPRPLDDTDAYFDRWIIINFPNQFQKNNSNNLLEQLTENGQLEGFLKLCLDWMPDLIENGFNYPLTVEEKRRLYLRLSDSAGTFLTEHCEFDTSYATPKEAVYAAFKVFCKNHQFAASTEKTFSRAVYTVYPQIQEARLKVFLSEERKRCWVGIKLVDSVESFQPNS